MEVFTKRPASSRLETSGAEAVPASVLTPESVQRLFVRRLSDICARFEDWSAPIHVAGMLGDVPDDCWRGRAATPLLDEQTQEQILLDISPSFLEKEGLQAGDYIQATGLLKARLQAGRVVGLFEVLSISKDKARYAAQYERELLQMMRGVVPHVRSFPTGEGVRLSLIGVGISQELLERLSHALGGFWTDRNTDTLLLASHQRDELSHSLADIQQALLLLVVGKTAAALLEDSTVLRELNRCAAYRVLACDVGEHMSVRPEEDRESGMIAPYLVEEFYTNPLKAGEVVRQRTGQELQRKDIERAQEEELTALRGSLASLTERLALSRQKPRWPALIGGIFIGGVIALCVWWAVVLLQHEGWFGRW